MRKRVDRVEAAEKKEYELTRNNIGTKDDYLELLHYWLEYIQSKSYVIGNDELSRAFFTSQ